MNEPKLKLEATEEDKAKFIRKLLKHHSLEKIAERTKKSVEELRTLLQNHPVNALKELP